MLNAANLYIANRERILNKKSAPVATNNTKATAKKPTTTKKGRKKVNG